MKQHYIPRCYLRRFSENGKSIWAYDKQNSKKYRASLMSVCCKDDMYSISDDYFRWNRGERERGINALTIEKEHFAGTVEPLFAQALRDLDGIKDGWVSGKDCYRLSFIEKREFALHIATQYLRLPQVQEATVDNCIRMGRATSDMLKEILSVQKGDDTYKRFQIDINVDKAALHASTTYMDYEALMSYADAIAENYWIFHVSSGNGFYSSDFPVVVVPHVTGVAPENMGLTQYGGELTYPFSPGLALSVYDRRFFPDKKPSDCSFVEAVGKEIRRQNMLRYFYAVRHIFSHNGSFGLIDFIRQEENGQHIFHTPNLRKEIVSGLGRY